MSPRFVGNSRSDEFHDLDNERPQCHIARLRGAGHDVEFVPDTQLQAIREGYEPCGWCIGTVADLMFMAAGGLPPAPADVTGHDLGGGRVALEWTFDGDPVADSVRFFVFTTPNCLDPVRTMRAEFLTETSVELRGIPGGLWYFTVVATRGSANSLPSAMFALSVAEDALPVATTPGEAGEPRGLAFPFAVDARGRIRTRSGDPLLRERVLQLLLTAPGERVVRPEYGTRIRDLVFDPNSDALAATTEFTISQALERYLGRDLKLENVTVRAGDATLDIDVVYRRKSDLTREHVSVGIPVP